MESCRVDSLVTIDAVTSQLVKHGPAVVVDDLEELRHHLGLLQTRRQHVAAELKLEEGVEALLKHPREVVGPVLDDPEPHGEDLLLVVHRGHAGALLDVVQDVGLVHQPVLLRHAQGPQQGLVREEVLPQKIRHLQSLKYI